MVRVDRRVKKTEISIRNAFEELASSRKLKEITVKELTNRADINRKTFYLHYDSIEDLVNSYVDVIANELIELLERHTFKEYYEHPGKSWNNLVDTLQDKKDFWLKLLFSDEYSYFSRKIEKILVENMAVFILKSFSISELDAKTCANFLIKNTLDTTRFFFYDLKCKDYNFIKVQVGKLNKFGIGYFFESLV